MVKEDIEITVPLTLDSVHANVIMSSCSAATPGQAMLMAVSLLTVSSANLVPRMAQGPMCLTVLRAHRSQPAQAKNESAKADFVNFVAAISIARELADKTFA